MADFDDYGQPQYSSGFSFNTSDMQGDLSATMRSLKDTLATSFQTLNLTLMSMNSTLKNVGGTMRSMAPSLSTANRSYLPSGGLVNQYGSLSPGLANHMANSSLTQLYVGDKPFSASSLDYGYQLQQERNYRWANMGANVAGAVGGFAATSIAGYGLGKGVGAMLPKTGAIGRLGASGFGRAALGLGGFMGAGMILQPVIDAVIDEAMGHISDTAGIKRMSTRFGTEFTNKQASMVSRSLRTSGYNELMNSDSFMTKLGKDGYKDVLMTGLAGGVFHGSSPEQLIKQMQGAAQVVKFLSGVMGDKDVASAMQTVVQLKGMGINVASNPGFAHSLGTQAFKYGTTSGLDAGTMLKMGMQGGQLFQQQGQAGFGGILPMMRNMALAHEMEKRHMLSTAELSVAGGAHGVAANMTAATAGILGSAQFGDVMLASGFDGKGFNLNKAAGAAAKGGYFGMVGAGAQNILKSPGDLARFYMNKTNMLAKLSEGGQQQEAAIAMVRSAIQNLPFMKTASYRDKEALTQVHTKEILQGMGLPADDATVKAIAAQVLHPGGGTNIENEGNRALQRAKYYDIRERSGTMRSVGRLMEGFERIPGALSYNTVGKLGMGLGDKFMDLTLSNYGEQSGYTAGNADGLTLTNTLGVYGSMKSKLGGLNDTLDAKDIAYAFKRMSRDYNGVDTSGSLGGGGPYNPLALGNFQGNEDLARTMMPNALGAAYRSESDYYNKLLGGINDGRSSNLARFANAEKGIMFSGGSYKEFMDFMDDYESSSEGRIFKNSDDTIALGMQGVYNYMKTKNKGQIDNINKQFLNDSRFSSFSRGYSSDMLSKLGISGDVSKLSPSELMRVVAQSGNAAGIAQQYGYTTKNLAAAISQKVYGKIGGDDDTALWGLNGNAMNDLQGTAAAWEAGRGRGDKLDRVREILDSGLTLTKNNAAYFKDLGFDDDMLAKTLSSETGVKDMEYLGKIMDAYANGGDYSTLADEIKSDSVGGLADKMLQDMSPEQMKAAMKKLGGNGASIVSAAMAAKGDATLRGQTSYLFGRQGNAIADAFKNAQNTGSFDEAYRLIMGMGGDDQQVKEVQEAVNSINRAKLSGNVGDLKGISGKLGINFDTLKGKSMQEIESTIMGTALQSSAADKEMAEKQQQLDNNDYRFAMTDDGKAFRVVIDQDKIRANSEAEKTAENLRKSGNVFIPDPTNKQAGTFPTTPANQSSNLNPANNSDSNWRNLYNRFSMGANRV